MQRPIDNRLWAGVILMALSATVDDATDGSRLLLGLIGFVLILTSFAKD